MRTALRRRGLRGARLAEHQPAHRDRDERDRPAPRVARDLVELERTPRRAERSGDVTLLGAQLADGRQRIGPQRVREVGRGGKPAFAPRTPRRRSPPSPPFPQRRREPHDALGLAGLVGALQRLDEVVGLGIEPALPGELVGRQQLRRDRLRQLEVVAAVALGDRRRPRLARPAARRHTRGRARASTAASSRRAPRDGAACCGRRAPRGLRASPRSPRLAASTVQPPANTLSSPNVARCASSSRLEAPVERRAHRAVAVGRVARPRAEARQARCSGGSRSPAATASPTRAAASSIASGRPSTREHTAAIAPAFPPSAGTRGRARRRAR